MSNVPNCSGEQFRKWRFSGKRIEPRDLIHAGNTLPACRDYRLYLVEKSPQTNVRYRVANGSYHFLQAPQRANPRIIGSALCVFILSFVVKKGRNKYPGPSTHKQQSAKRSNWTYPCGIHTVYFSSTEDIQ